MKLALIATLSALLLVVAGCAQYQYGDKTYSSGEEMVQGARAEFDGVLAGIKPADPRLGGRALIVVPTRSVIQAAIKEMNPTADSSALDPIIDVVEADLLTSAESVRKAAVFDDAKLLRDDNPDGALFDTYDYKLWLLMESMAQFQWYLSRKEVATREPVSADKGLPRLDQYGSFVLGVVTGGKRLGATPIQLSN